MCSSSTTAAGSCRRAVQHPGRTRSRSTRGSPAPSRRSSARRGWSSGPTSLVRDRARMTQRRTLVVHRRAAARPGRRGDPARAGRHAARCRRERCPERSGSRRRPRPRVVNCHVHRPPAGGKMSEHLGARAHVAPAARRARPASSSISAVASAHRSAGNRAIASLLAAATAEPRPVQREEEDYESPLEPANTVLDWKDRKKPMCSPRPTRPRSLPRRARRRRRRER